MVGFCQHGDDTSGSTSGIILLSVNWYYFLTSLYLKLSVATLQFKLNRGLHFTGLGLVSSEPCMINWCNTNELGINIPLIQRQAAQLMGFPPPLS
jgi:hypothetical protein